MRLHAIAEDELTGGLREALDDLLGTEFGSILRAPHGRAWTHFRPALRVVALDGDRAVGQVALVEAGRRAQVTGIADLIVARAARGQGLASRLLETALSTEPADGAAVVFAASDRPRVRGPLISRLGFRPARPFELYWVEADRCAWNPDWVLRGSLRTPAEVIGDV